MNFKKKISIVLVMTMVLGLCACSNGTLQTKKKEDALIPVCNAEGLWGYIDQKGKEVIELKYVDVANEFSEGLAYASPSYFESGGGMYGFINEKGEMVIKANWDKVENFSQGAARVGVIKGYDEFSKPEYKWALIDKEGMS